jgi:hypothetical protein
MQKYKTHSGYQLSKGRRSRGQKPWKLNILKSNL